MRGRAHADDWRVRLAAVATAGAALAAAGCGARALPSFPTGPSSSLGSAAPDLEPVVSRCQGLDHLAAEIRLSGRAAGRRLRGTLHTGTTTLGRVRVELLAGFGGPALVLVAESGRATLYLPRDGRVLTGEPVTNILEALVGVGVSEEDLHALLTGCLGSGARVTGGRAYANGTRALDLDDQAVVWFAPASGGAWPAGWRRGDLTVAYTWQGGGQLPSAIRLVVAQASAGSQASAADLTLRFVSHDTTVAFEPATFQIKVPPDAAPLTLDELRRAGPLGS